LEIPLNCSGKTPLKYPYKIIDKQMLGGESFQLSELQTSESRVEAQDPEIVPELHYEFSSSMLPSTPTPPDNEEDAAEAGN